MKRSPDAWPIGGRPKRRDGCVRDRYTTSTSDWSRPRTTAAWCDPDRPNSILHQRHHLGREALQALDAARDALAPEVEDQLVHADGGERTDVAGDVMGVAGEAAASPVAIRNAGVVQRRLVGDGEACEITPLRLRHPLQRLQMRLHFLRRERRGSDGADRVPAIAVPRGAAQRGAGVAADPYGGMRLLQREGFGANVGIVVELAGEA